MELRKKRLKKGELLYSGIRSYIYSTGIFFVLLFAFQVDVQSVSLLLLFAIFFIIFVSISAVILLINC